MNDVRFGYNRVAIGVFPENPQIDNASVGMPALATNPRDAGLSLISVAGFSPLGHEYNNPQASTSDTFQVSDTATWARGSHLVKFGGEWYGVRQAAYRDVQARGFLTFVDQGYTGNALADLLLGLPVLTGGARLDNPQNLRAHCWSAVRPRRLAGPARADDLGGTALRLRLPGRSTATTGPPLRRRHGQLVGVGGGLMPRGGYVPDRNNLAPRAGFAWTLDRVRAHGAARRLRHLLQPERRWRRPKGCTSTRPTSTWASTSRRRACRR